MFSDLIATSPRVNRKKKAAIFLGTSVFYVALLVGAFVTSILLPDVSIAAPVMGDTVDVVWVQKEEVPVKKVSPKIIKAKGGSTSNVSNGGGSPKIVNEVVYNTPVVKSNEVAKEGAKETPRSIPVQLGTAIDNKPSGDYGYGNGYGDNSGGDGKGNGIGPSVTPTDGEEAPPKIEPKPTPAPTPVPEKKKVIISRGPINGYATSKPEPVYPKLAIAAHVQGIVVVSIIVGENGSVISANAVSGHPLLMKAAEDAARRAKFEPTTLAGVKMKVSGTITYNFKLN